MSTLMPKIKVIGQTIQTGERPQTNGRTHGHYGNVLSPLLRAVVDKYLKRTERRRRTRERSTVCLIGCRMTWPRDWTTTLVVLQVRPRTRWKRAPAATQHSRELEGSHHVRLRHYWASNMTLPVRRRHKSASPSSARCGIFVRMS